MAKALTFDQVAERKRKAEQFVRDVKGNEERADEIADESVQDYATRGILTLWTIPKGG